jgi:hypothetical protein
MALYAAVSSEGGVLAFSPSQAVLKSALAVSRSLADPIGSALVMWMVMCQCQRGRHLLVGKADPADALAAVEHGVVTEAD